MISDAKTIHSMTRKPAAYTMIVLRKPDGLEYYGLTYCKHRQAFIEPITNRDAIEVIGPCEGWRYDERGIEWNTLVAR